MVESPVVLGVQVPDACAEDEKLIINGMKDRRPWQSGTFKLGKGRSIAGELKLEGPKSRLCLYDSHFFNARALDDASIHGVLRDLTKVSLLDCVSLQSSEHGGPKEKRYVAHLFPNYVVLGEKYLRSTEKVITSAEFLIGDAATLFYDFDAFGTVVNAKAHIEQLVKANRVNREIPVGSNPIIQYFTGKHQIVTAKTEIGHVSASHRMRHGMGGPEGVAIKNEIWISVEFGKKRSFHEALRDLYRLVRFLEVVIGRQQNVPRLRMRRGPLASENIYEVACSHPWRRKGKGFEKPHPGDMLLDPVREGRTFGSVLRNWLRMDEERLVARNRFASSFAQGSSFNVDRTIAVANAFDILPASAVPSDVPLDAGLLAAKAHCRQVFKSLPSSPERDSILNALGRIGKSSLKRKVRHRVEYITKAVGERLPELVMVADEAVNCRNYYVHGGVARLNYQEEYIVSTFLTESLEFIFSGSELIEAGWDIRSWKETHSGISHPIGRYILNYKPQLERLKAALRKGGAAE